MKHNRSIATGRGSQSEIVDYSTGSFSRDGQNIIERRTDDRSVGRFFHARHRLAITVLAAKVLESVVGSSLSEKSD